MLLWTWVYKYLLESLLLFPVGRSGIPRNGIAESYGNSPIFWGTTILCSIVAAPFYIPACSAQVLQFLHILADFVFLIIAILLGVKCYLIVALICIFLMTNDVDHPFMCLLAFVYLLGRNVQPSHELDRLFLCCWNGSSSYILDINLLSNGWLADIFSPILWVVFSESW